MATCPNDGKEFVPRRRWQRFCEPRCRYQFRWRQFRVVPADKLHQLTDLARDLAAADHVVHRAA